MKETLLKKRLGIPAALLILLVLAGVATACVVHNFTYTITTEEPLTFTEIDGLNTIYQGESDDIKVYASNAAGIGYGIFVDAEVVQGQIDSITYTSNPTGKVVSTEQELNEDLNGDSDTWDARYNIGANGGYDIVVTVDSADDAASGDLQVSVAFNRKVEY